MAEIKIPAELERKIAETQAEQRREDQAAEEALKVPFPGPTRDALALDQSIMVRGEPIPPPVKAGKWRVRAFQDGDWEVLAALDHPMEKTMQEQLKAKFAGEPPPPEKVFIPRGPLMYQLAWVMTHDGVEVDKTIVAEGADRVRELARQEFGRESSYTLAQVLFPAIMEQIERNWSPMQGYKPERKDGAPDAAENPLSLGQPLTASAGSLTSMGG